jgi:hypothetical protein
MFSFDILLDSGTKLVSQFRTTFFVLSQCKIRTNVGTILRKVGQTCMPGPILPKVKITYTIYIFVTYYQYFFA